MALWVFSNSFFNFYLTQGLISTDLPVRMVGDFGDLLTIYFSFCLCFTQSKSRSNLQSGLVEAHLANMRKQKYYETTRIRVYNSNYLYNETSTIRTAQSHRICLRLTKIQKSPRSRPQLRGPVRIIKRYQTHQSQSTFRTHHALIMPARFIECDEVGGKPQIGLHAENPIAYRKQPNKIQEAEKQMNRLMEQNKELKTTFQLYKAIALLKDDFQTHKLSQKQENILEGMKSWLYKSGAKYQKLKVVNLYPGYRGVIATKHIKKKQQIVYIPKSELITLEMARANQTSQIIIQKNVRLHSPKHTLLSILLLELKNTPNSRYQPYIDLLPEDHSCFPINYTKEELELLDGSPFLNMIYEKVIGLKKDYETVIKCDPNFKKYTFKQFCWARNMVGSRIFGLVVKGVKTEILVPFADMLNHRHPKQTIWSYQQSMNGFIIESEEDIEVGQQVFDSYGKKCNSRYLLSYGFTLEDNQDNEISIKIEIDEKDPLCRMKKEVIRENVNETYTQIRKINLNFHNNKFYQFMGALRFITIDEEETLNMLKKISNIQLTKQAYVMVRTPPISVKNQLKVWVKLLTLCQNSLSKYQGTLEQDRQLLKSKKLTQNERNIISLRMGQKHILKQFILASSQVIKILQSPNIIEALEQNKSKNYAKYLYKILSLTPGINKKNLDKRLSPHFSAFIEEKQLQDTEQIAES